MLEPKLLPDGAICIRCEPCGFLAQCLALEELYIHCFDFD